MFQPILALFKKFCLFFHIQYFTYTYTLVSVAHVTPSASDPGSALLSPRQGRAKPQRHLYTHNGFLIASSYPPPPPTTPVYVHDKSPAHMFAYPPPITTSMIRCLLYTRRKHLADVNLKLTRTQFFTHQVFIFCSNPKNT